ncbi:seven-hairpin glycosidase [Teratosphaeria nubilosa]|uniref:alpha-1,2-Mannosidase n=1 Tax=Teratosphaeria nubilosa TaxID=161662 RepID=A0A6G1L438_9PEZI|nr:seven-hairpin glycosidase [Teratosphaeria nubilosa]
MMPGRRRVRYIALLLVFALTTLVYYRRAQVDRYGSTVAEKMVGGGAVLRKPEEQQKPTVAPITGAAAFVPPSQAVLQPTRPPTSIAPTLESEVESPSTSSAAARTAIVPTTTARPVLPLSGGDDDNDDDDDTEGQVLPIEVEGGPKVAPTPTSTTHTEPHWTPEPEKYPVPSTIALPISSPQPIPKIQYHGNDAGKADNERLAMIKAATSHAWNAYKEAAFGADEVRPISGGQNNPFNGWGATLVDSLDTLWIMGMEDEFNEAVEAVRKIDFTTSPRPDIPLFETVIRFLGGLMAAYDVSGRQRKYKVLLDQALQLGEILYGAFDTPNRMPDTYYRWMPPFSYRPHRSSNRMVLAELGSLSLEFTRLAQLTAEPKYYDAIARITDALVEWQNSTRLPGMWPTVLDATRCEKPAQEAAAAPVRQHAREKVLGPADTLPQWTKPKKAQSASLTAKSKTGLSDGENIENDEPVEGSSLGHKSRDKLVSEKLSSANARTKRQLDLPSSNKKQLLTPVDSTLHKQEPREDSGTEEDVCRSPDLASTSDTVPEVFSLGGQSDSTYEYLPKEYLLLGGRIEQYRTMYETFADTAIEHLMARPMTPENLDLLISGKLEVRINHTSGEYHDIFIPQSEHLTCFAGGMFAMGGKIFDRPDDIEIGRKLTDGCVWGYNSTTTGIMPESFIAMICQDRTDKKCQWDERAYWRSLDPYADTRTVDTTAATAGSFAAAAAFKRNEAFERTHEKRDAAPERLDGEKAMLLQEEDAKKEEDGQVASNSRTEPATTTQQGHATVPSRTASDQDHEHSAAGSGNHDDVYAAKAPTAHEEFVKNKIANERLPPGFTKVDAAKYILRPEAIESVFYMYRITGEEHWREAGWQMFLAIDNHTRTLYGNAAIDDVTKEAPIMRDSMESFWLAETLKYFYLLYDDMDTWSLDEWVLNTEAHLFRRPG